MSESLIRTESEQLRFETPRGLPLVVTIPGLTDAGNTVSGLDEFIREQCDPSVVFRFNPDVLLDYRARRPVVTLENERIQNVQTDTLTLSVAHDELGRMFLHLSGFEPDYRWESFVNTVLRLMDEFEVENTTIFHAIPMPVPHTRPTKFTLTGTREDLISENTSWKPRTKVAGSVVNLLEFRLQELGEEVVSWAVMVPHYLASNDYPVSVLAALSAMSKSTGLLFDTDDLSESADTFLDVVNQQISDQPENRELVHEIEKRFDRFQMDQDAREELLGEDGVIPSADELAGEFEQFLAKKNDSEPPEEDESE
jgi:hypothetical protein